MELQSVTFLPLGHNEAFFFFFNLRALDLCSSISVNLAHSKKHLTAQNSSKLFILPVYTICFFIHGCLLQG